MHELHHEMSSLLQAMLLRELRDLREGGNQGLSAKLDEVLQAVKRSHETEMANIDSEAAALRAQITEIASNPDATMQVAKLKALAATLNAMAPTTPP